MMDNKTKENVIVGIIMTSMVSNETKTELIDYVRSSSSEKRACFRLGQMDFRESAVMKLQECATHIKGIARKAMLSCADLIGEMEA